MSKVRVVTEEDGKIYSDVIGKIEAHGYGLPELEDILFLAEMYKTHAAERFQTAAAELHECGVTITAIEDYINSLLDDADPDKDTPGVVYDYDGNILFEGRARE